MKNLFSKPIVSVSTITIMAFSLLALMGIITSSVEVTAQSCLPFEICDNQIDDNCDGYIDCDDESCVQHPFCQDPICGNDILENGEDCDDGNTEDGDGCSANCTIEAECETDPDCDDGLACNGLETCVDNQCVQGIPVICYPYNITAVGTCDYDPDNNPFTWDFRDLFNSVCEEPSGTCITGDSTITHTCDVGCGGCEVDADCDDQDETTTDTCNLTTCACENTPILECTTDPDCDDGYACNGAETCVNNECVDGIQVICYPYNITAVGTCDYDPDNNPFTWDFRDLFNSVCVEPTGICTTSDGTIIHTCDTECDAECVTNEDCNDEDETTSDACNLDTCECENIPIQQAECGNGILEEGEKCDDGSANGQECSPACESTCNYCTISCTTASLTGGSCGGGGGGGGGGGVTRYCGDGLLTTIRGEECDDRNTIDGDGCSSICKLEGEVLGEAVEEEVKGEVLGESVVLPETGQDPSILIFAGLFVLFGLGVNIKELVLHFN